MKYSDYVEVNEGFQTSINLEYDLNKAEKVRSYIPTEQSVQLIGRFLRSFYYNNESQNRASVLIGPYGRGKSHLLLVLSALTSMDVYAATNCTYKEAKKIQKDICEKIRRVDEEIGALAQTVVESDIRALPVIINSNTGDINQAFLSAIKNALEYAGLESLLPTTYFDSAVEVLDRWKTEYPEVLEKLSDELTRRKSTFETLYMGLKQFDQAAYDEFCECYPLVAAGTKFNPLTNTDVVKLYISVARELCEQTSYTGINIVFDEFSKFLEANLDSSKMLNFKIIQDMAEAATRSGKEQVHFTCVTHKDILDYSSSDSFKTVEGRFSKVQYIASSEQSYELIANAIPKKRSFARFVREHEESFERAKESAFAVNVFGDLSHSNFEKKVVRGCFPLAPLSAFAMLHISELVGQNERTLFTFLAKNDPYSMPAFLEADRERLDFITVDTVYDYFRDLIKKEVFNTSIHTVCAKTEGALRQTANEDQKRVLKAIAIINMIGDERFKAIPSHIKPALMMDDNTFEAAVNALCKVHTLSQRDSSEYVMLTANGVDVQKSVEAYVNTKISRINICGALEEFAPMGYELPREYNDKFSMLRYYKKMFMDVATLDSYKTGSQMLADYPYDGLIVYIVAQGEVEREKVLTHLPAFEDARQIVVCISTIDFCLEANLKKLQAVQRLKDSDAAKDQHYLEELEIYEEDLSKQVLSSINSMFGPASKHSSYYNCAGKLVVNRQSDLNRAISNICIDVYSKTPVINNEMVNKEVLNAQNLKGRNIVLDWLLQHSEDIEIPCMSGFGPEVSVFRSAFEHTGLAKNDIVDDPGMNEALDIIGAFIAGCEGKNQSFSVLYGTLRAAPYGIRLGIIPLLIAYVMRKYKDSAIIRFKGKEVELSASVLASINSNPSDYELLIEQGTQEAHEILDKMLALFADYADASTQSVNRIYKVTKCMQIWMRSLSEYTKKHAYTYKSGEKAPIEKNVKAIRDDLMKFEINSRELLFVKWKNSLSETGSLSECFDELCRAKEELDTHIASFKRELMSILVNAFAPGYSGSLSKAVQYWYENLPDATKTHVFDSDTNALLLFVAKWTSFDDSKLLDELARMQVSMAIEDWSDKMADAFVDQITEEISKINGFTADEGDGQDCELTIRAPGSSIQRSFSGADISPLGMTVLNNLRSVFEEYNGAIDPDEQLAIMTALIGEIIQ